MAIEPPSDFSPFTTRPCAQTRRIKGVEFPAHLAFRQLLVTGPPGCGKSTQIARLGGWSEEGYIDLTMDRWWSAQLLSMRPREIHLGLPFPQVTHGLAVFDHAWSGLAARPAPELGRIIMPPRKRFFFSVDWYSRYVFEFLLPPAEVIHERRRLRAGDGSHIVDQEGYDLALIQDQVHAYWLTAVYFRLCGLSVYIRQGGDSPPEEIILPEE